MIAPTEGAHHGRVDTWFGYYTPPTIEEYVRAHPASVSTLSVSRPGSAGGTNDATSNPRQRGARPDASVSPPNLLEYSETSVQSQTGVAKAKPIPPCQLPENPFCPSRLSAPGAGAKFRHSGWSIDRGRVYASIYRTAGSQSRLDAFRLCGEHSQLAKRWNGETNQTEWKVIPNLCHDRFCVPCAVVRARRMRDAAIALVAGRPMSFITLTLKGEHDDLSTTIDRLFSGFKTLRKSKLWTAAVRGGVAFLETKWSPTKTRWHTHLHIIADCDFIPQPDLSAEWLKATGDSYIVDIRRVSNESHALFYVTKYASKPLNSSFVGIPDRLDDAVRALKGRRLATCFGSWYGHALSKVETDEAQSTADKEEAAGWQKVISLSWAVELAEKGDVEFREALQQIGYWPKESG